MEIGTDFSAANKWWKNRNVLIGAGIALAVIFVINRTGKKK